MAKYHRNSDCPLNHRDSPKGKGSSSSHYGKGYDGGKHRSSSKGRGKYRPSSSKGRGKGKSRSSKGKRRKGGFYGDYEDD
eukprot:7323038-Pyramimonas_sp.AAC.1